MALLPFASQTYRIKEQSPDTFRVVTNTGFSPFWFFVAAIALFQEDYLKYGLIAFAVLASGFRTVWTIHKPLNAIACSRKVWGVVVFHQKLVLNAIQRVKIEGVNQPRNRTEYVLIFETQEEEIAVAQRVQCNRILSLRNEFKPYLPQNIDCVVDTKCNEKVATFSL